MVRNPRMLMMCGLLAAATGLALGSRPPVPADGPLGSALLAALVPGFGLWAAQDWTAPRAIDAPASAAAAGDAPAVPIDLEGRHPRRPRSPRDADRLAR